MHIVGSGGTVGVGVRVGVLLGGAEVGVRVGVAVGGAEVNVGVAVGPVQVAVVLKICGDGLSE